MTDLDDGPMLAELEVTRDVRTELERAACDTCALVLRDRLELPAALITDLAFVRDDDGAPDELRDRASELLAAALQLN